MGVALYHKCLDCHAIIADGADGIRAHGDGRCDAAEVRGIEYALSREAPKGEPRRELLARRAAAMGRMSVRPE